MFGRQCILGVVEEGSHLGDVVHEDTAVSADIKLCVVLLVREVFTDTLEVGDAYRLKKFLDVGADDTVVLQYTAAQDMVHGDVLLVGTGPFAWVALLHHLHQFAGDAGGRFLFAGFQQGQNVGHHFRSGYLVVPPVVGGGTVFVPRAQCFVDGTEQYLVAVERGLRAGICGGHALDAVQVVGGFPVGTEETFVVYLWPSAFGRH